MRAAAALAIAATLSGCFWGSVVDDKLTGPYKLWAADVTERASLCWGRRVCPIGPMVTDAGFDARFVVAKISPNESTQKVSFSPAFYYIERRPDEAERVSDEAIHGPLTKVEYEAARARLGLPEFSRHIQ